MKRCLTLSLISGLLVLLLSGCATRYRVKLDALSTGQIIPATGQSGVSYVLASNTPEVSESDLFFKEVARYINPVLKEQGFHLAGEGEKADLEISVDAHLSDPMVESRTYSEPVYVEYGGRFSYVRVPVVNREGRIVRFAYSQYYYPSRTHFAGWVDQNWQITVYDKVLKLSARQILDDGSLSDEVWAITVSMRDSSTDYRAALPYMLIAAGPYIGKRTEGERVVTISKDDPELQAYRASLSNGR